MFSRPLCIFFLLSRGSKKKKKHYLSFVQQYSSDHRIRQPTRDIQGTDTIVSQYIGVRS